MTRAFCILLLAAAAMAQIRRMPPPPPSEPSTPAGTASIEGTVSDAVTQAPLRKAQVNINGPLAAPTTAVTDASGRFAFRELAAGNYWLNASKQGYNVPQAIFAAAPNNEAVVGDGEHKKGVEISLMPDGSIGGRVVDEEGLPVRGCGVVAAQFVYEQNRRTLQSRGYASTSENGEYRLGSLAPGRYYVFTHCHQQLAAAHPLLPRGDPRIPHETYLPQLYGGGVDPAAATRLTVQAGSRLDNIDFQLTRAPAYTLRGSVVGGDPGARPSVSVMLMPVNRTMRTLMLMNAQADAARRTFQIPAVIPGSYLLAAYTNNRDGRVFAAERPVEIGQGPPEPVQLSLQSGVDLKGSVQFDSDDHPPLENSQISLASIDTAYFMRQLPAKVEQDGTFTLTGVLPGRWRLIVSSPGYLKAATLAGQTVAPGGFQIAAGAAGPLRITLGSKLADVHVEVENAPAGQQLSAVIFPEDLGRLGIGLERAGVMANGSADFGGLAPGRYRVFATDSPSPWLIVQRPDWLKALENLGAAIDVPEGGRVSATLETIPREEVLRALEENE
jgi:hypothetical protein